MKAWSRTWSEQAESLFEELLKVEPLDRESGLCLYCEMGLGHRETCPWLRGRLLLSFGEELKS